MYISLGYELHKGENLGLLREKNMPGFYEVHGQ